MKVTVKEVSDFLGISQPTVRIFLEEGKFPFGTAGYGESGERRVAYIHPILWEKFKKGELSFGRVEKNADIGRC